jgi:hypothetical protein
MSILLPKIQVDREGIAKLALEVKFDDFDAGSVSCKLTYPIGYRRFARNPIPRQKHKFGPQCSFAIPSRGNCSSEYHV